MPPVSHMFDRCQAISSLCDNTVLIGLYLGPVRCENSIRRTRVLCRTPLIVMDHAA